MRRRIRQEARVSADDSELSLSSSGLYFCTRHGTLTDQEVTLVCYEDPSFPRRSCALCDEERRIGRKYLVDVLLMSKLDKELYFTEEWVWSPFLCNVEEPVMARTDADDFFEIRRRVERWWAR